MVGYYIYLNVDEVICGKSASFYGFPQLNKISFCESLPDERGKKERSFLKAPLFFASFIPVGAESMDSGVVGVSASVLLMSGKDSAQCRVDSKNTTAVKPEQKNILVYPCIVYGRPDF